MNILAVAAIGFVVTVLAVLTLRPLAKSIDLLDRPGGRKNHDGEVPLVGGLAMFFGIVAGLGLLDPPIPSVGPLLGVFAVLVIIGLLDDRFAVSHWTRLAVHAVAAVALLLGTGTVVTQLGNPFGSGDIVLHGVGALIFTMLLFAGAINAFNMLDGMDGLAGTTALTSIGGLVWLMAVSGAIGDEEIAVCAVVGAATVGFLVFNAPVAGMGSLRCFMGDAGSTLLGALVGWLCIRAGQIPVEGTAHPVAVLWIVAVPLFELLCTVVRRLLRGRSPLAADSEHFHHVLMRAGFSVPAAFLTFAILNVMLIGIGITLRVARVPDVASFLMWIAMGIAFVRLIHLAHYVVPFLPASGRSSKSRRQSLVD